jgi:hypothetical protein
MKTRVIHDPIEKCFNVQYTKWWWPSWIQDKTYHYYNHDSSDYEQARILSMNLADRLSKREVIYESN